MIQTVLVNRQGARESRRGRKVTQLKKLSNKEWWRKREIGKSTGQITFAFPIAGCCYNCKAYAPWLNLTQLTRRNYTPSLSQSLHKSDFCTKSIRLRSLNAFCTRCFILSYIGMMIIMLLHKCLWIWGKKIKINPSINGRTHCLVEQNLQPHIE